MEKKTGPGRLMTNLIQKTRAITLTRGDILTNDCHSHFIAFWNFAIPQRNTRVN